jgi:light-regulated signal transduction histidine kinase (bacteriophytochrome)
LTSREGRRRSSSGVRGSPNALGSLKHKARRMGLGLRAAKRFLEGREGLVRVESHLEKGSAFTVTLPVTPKVEEMNKR